MTHTPSRARIPADIEREDRVMLNLTARQLAILALTGAIAGGVVWIADQLAPGLPPPMLAVLVLPLAAVGVALAFGQRDGVSLDRLAVAALQQAWTARRSTSVSVSTSSTKPATSRLRECLGWLLPPAGLPVACVDDDGVVDLGADGLALVCEATPVNFALRSPQEQAAQVGSMTRFLHTLTGPTQILIRTRPTDLQPVLDELMRQIRGLPDPALRTAARDHVGFLTDIQAQQDVFTRTVLVTFHQPVHLTSRSQARDKLRRRAEDAAAALAGVAVTLTPLPRARAVHVLGLDAPAPERDTAVPVGEELTAGRSLA